MLNFFQKKEVFVFVQIVGVAIISVMSFLSCSRSASDAVTTWRIGSVTKASVLTEDQKQLFNSLYSAAINERIMERYDAAYLLLQQALSINPNAPEALYEMAMISLHYGDEKGTVRVSAGDTLLKRAVALAPDNLEYLEAYGAVLAEKEKYAEAIHVFEDLVERKETDGYLSQLLNLYRAAGQEEQALQVLDRLEKLNGPTNSIYFERYRIFISLEDTTKAFAAIDDLCAANPGDLYYVALKGNLYHEQGYNDKALSLFQKVLAKEPKHTFARMSLLSFYKTLKEDRLYEELFDQMVDDPDLESDARNDIMRQFYVDALQNKTDTAKVLPIVRRVMALPLESRALGELTLAYLSEINMPRSEMAFVHERILELEPDFNVSRLELIFANVDAENREKVHQLCEEGRKYSPGQIAYYIYDGLALNEMGKPEEAIKVLVLGEEKVDTTTDLQIRSQMLAFLGDLYFEADDKIKAYEAYDQAITYDGDNLSCMNNYAYFLSKDGIHLDKAESMSKVTIEAEPDNPTYLDTYAWILYIQENYTQAKIYIDETLKHSEPIPDNVTLFDHAGDIYYRCGETELAIGFWKKAFKLAEDQDLKKLLKSKIRRGKI